MKVEKYEKLLKQVYRTAPIGLCLFDTELRYRYINEWLASINGLSIEAHLGRTIREVIPDVSAGVESLLRGVMETGEPVLDGVVEAETPASPDQKRIFEHSYHAIRSDEGIVVGVSCIVQDITERKRANEQLRSNEERFRSVVESGRDGIILADGTARIISWNQAAQTIFGYSEEEVLGKPLTMLMPERYRESHSKGLELYAQTGEARVIGQTVELDGLRKDGSEFPLELSLSTWKSAEGQFFCGIIREITKRKRAEAALIESRNQLEERVQARTAELTQSNLRQRALLESTHAVPWEADITTWQFTYVGPQATRLLGYPPQQWLDIDFWTSHIHPEDREFALDYCVRSAKSRANFDFEYRMITADGRTIWIHDIVNVQPEAGEPKTLRGFMIDITERKHAQEELRRNRDDMQVLARRLLSAHEDERRRIARELHDDLSQRLASVAIDSSMLESEIRPVTESGADKLAKLADRIRRLSSDIHHVSRQLHPSIIDELGLVKAMQSECDTFQRRSGIALRFEWPSEYNLVAKSTELALYRIMQECLRNIEKHSRAVSARVRLSVSETEISLTISDTGTGFDPTQQREEPGLGMASLKERAGLLGGTVSIQSEIGRGTTVTAHLPLQRRES